MSRRPGSIMSAVKQRVWTFLLCVAMTSGSAAACFWDVRDPCLLDCLSGTADEINAAVTANWKDRIQCQPSGMKLKLGSSISFTTNWTLPSNWFNAEAKITELTLDCRNIEYINDNAFVSDAFRTIEKLNIISPHYNQLMTVRSLEGLPFLKELRFERASFRAIHPRVLDAVSDSLESFYLQEDSRTNPTILVDSITGGRPMKKLTTVKIQRNLKDTITERSFVALVNVTSLDLSNCQIETIAARSFDPISETIRVLNLSRNRIANLAIGLLDRLVVNLVQIHLSDNQWDCNCSLCYLKWLINNGYFVGMSTLRCRLPQFYRDQTIAETPFCPNVACDDYAIEASPNDIIPSTTTSRTSSTTTTPTTTTQGPEECDGITSEPKEDDVKGVDIPSDHIMKFLVTTNSSVAVLVEAQACNIFLLWFDSSREVFRTPTLRESQAHGCSFLAATQNASTNFQQVVMINTLKPNTPYVFCLMQDPSLKVAPRSCMPYFSGVSSALPEEEVWLRKKDQTLRICLMVLVIVGSVLGGFMVAYMMLRWHTRKMTKKIKATVCTNRSSFDSNTETTDISKRQRSISMFERKQRSLRRGSEGSNISGQSYALAINLSRFDIVQRQLDKQMTPNQYYLENMPYAMAPQPPNDSSWYQSDLLPAYGDVKPLTEIAVSIESKPEHIYSDIESQSVKLEQTP